MAYRVGETVTMRVDTEAVLGLAHTPKRTLRITRVEHCRVGVRYDAVDAAGFGYFWFTGAPCAYAKRGAYGHQIKPAAVAADREG